MKPVSLSAAVLGSVIVGMTALAIILPLTQGPTPPAAAVAPVADHTAPALDRDALRAEVRAYLLEQPEVLMEAISVLENRQAAAQATADNDLVAQHAEAIFADGYSWVGGNPDGDVIVVEFVDYRCGYCRKAHDDVAKLVDSDENIKLIVKEFPILGEDSLTSSKFAVATRMIAGDKAYKRVHDELIKLRGGVNDTTLGRIARQAEVDFEAVKALMDSDQVRQELLTNRALAEALGVNGTPTFVVGNEILRGYLPLDAMRQIVAEERAEG